MLQHQPKQTSGDSVMLATLFARYFDKHASQLKRAGDYRIVLNYWLDFYGDATLDEAAQLNRQETFRAWLAEEKQLNANTIRKIITIGKSAFNWAHKRGEIEQVPYFEMVKVAPPAPKGRHLEIDEIAKLLTLSEHRHLKLFLLLLMGTAARPQAIYDLRFEQIDFEQDLIDLNPAGYVPSRNKRRPVVKLPRQLKPVLLEQQKCFDNPIVISYDGKPVKSVRTTWTKLRARAGLDKEVMLYSFRRTMAKYLRMKGVPAWELAEQLGHRSTGYQITELYTAHSPDYLNQALDAIEAFFDELSCELRVKTLMELF